MVVKVYISGMSGNKEFPRVARERRSAAPELRINAVKKRQQRVTMILDSKHIPYSIVDITEPGQEAEKDFMQKNSQRTGATVSDLNPRHPLPPQIFSDGEYCGDYDDFDMANEVDNLEVFLKLEAPKAEVSQDQQKNGTGDAQDPSQANSSEMIAAEDDAEQRALLEAAAAMGKREDAEDEEQPEPEDVEIAEEEEVSSKLVDTDDPMLAEQEQEE